MSARRCGRFKGGVSFFFQFQRQILIPGRDDPAVHKHVHMIGHDVVKQPLIMGDHYDASVRSTQCINAIGDNPEGVDVQA